MSAKWVQRLFSAEVGIVRFLCGRVISKRSDLFVHANPCTKFPCVFAEMHTEKSSFVSAAQFLPILVIFGARCFSEIVELIVRSVSVFVIYVTTWDTSFDIEKSKSLRPIGFPVESDRNVSATVKMAGYIASRNSERSSYFPSKQPSFRTIAQNFAQSFGGNVGRIFGSHDVTISQIGKRRGRIDSACLASSLYHLKNALLRLEALEIEGA